MNIDQNRIIRQTILNSFLAAASRDKSIKSVLSELSDRVRTSSSTSFSSSSDIRQSYFSGGVRFARSTATTCVRGVVSWAPFHKMESSSFRWLSRLEKTFAIPSRAWCDFRDITSAFCLAGSSVIWANILPKIPTGFNRGNVWFEILP